MWAWFKSFFSVGVNKDPLRFLKKAIRIAVGLVIANNPQFAVPVGAAIAAIEALIKSKSPSAVIDNAIVKALDELANNVTNNPILKAEIKDLKHDIIFEIKDLPESEKLAKMQEIIDAFKVGLEAAKIK